MPAEPILTEPAPGVAMIDTGMARQRELNAVFLLRSREPCLIEAAPEKDGETVLAASTSSASPPRTSPTWW